MYYTNISICCLDSVILLAKMRVCSCQVSVWLNTGYSLMRTRKKPREGRRRMCYICPTAATAMGALNTGQAPAFLCCTAAASIHAVEQKIQILNAQNSDPHYQSISFSESINTFFNLCGFFLLACKSSSVEIALPETSRHEHDVGTRPYVNLVAFFSQPPQHAHPAVVAS